MRPALLRGQPRPHMLYLHTEKTGGSSIECATQGDDNVLARGLFTNMGHTSVAAVDRCRRQCVHEGVPAQTIISIREPYAWWRSLYRYGFIGRNAAIMTGKDFAGFMADASRNRGWAQSSNIRRACGAPCNADHILHTETLGADWLRLLIALDLPLVALPHVNPTATGEHSNRVPGRTIFTQEIVDIIHFVDGPMFAEFGYTRRNDVPFELGAS